MAEREVCSELASEARSSEKLVFCLDDKLGSHWQFLPIPPGTDGGSTVSACRATLFQELATS
eukprot:3933466-Pleurochrysis_carterae.AAC.1